MTLRIRKAYCFPGTIRYKEWDTGVNCESITIEGASLVVQHVSGVMVYSSGWEAIGDEVTTPPATPTPKGKR